MSNFLKVEKELYGKGLKAIDLLIISQIKEFNRNNKECYITNKQFSDMFGESIDTIKRSIDRLEQTQVIIRRVCFIAGNNKATKQRVLTMNKNWDGKYSKPARKKNISTIGKADVVEGAICTDQNQLEGAKIENGRCKFGKMEGAICTNKRKGKDKVKDNFLSKSKTENEKKKNEGSNSEELPPMANKAKENEQCVANQNVDEMDFDTNPLQKILSEMGIDIDCLELNKEN